MTIRDHFMHGIGHSYSVHLLDEGIFEIEKQVKYLLKEVRPKLAGFLEIHSNNNNNNNNNNNQNTSCNDRNTKL